MPSTHTQVCISLGGYRSQHSDIICRRITILPFSLPCLMSQGCSDHEMCREMITVFSQAMHSLKHGKKTKCAHIDLNLSWQYTAWNASCASCKVSLEKKWAKFPPVINSAIDHSGASLVGTCPGDAFTRWRPMQENQNALGKWVQHVQAKSFSPPSNAKLFYWWGQEQGWVFSHLGSSPTCGMGCLGQVCVHAYEMHQEHAYDMLVTPTLGCSLCAKVTEKSYEYWKAQKETALPGLGGGISTHIMSQVSSIFPAFPSKRPAIIQRLLLFY